MLGVWEIMDCQKHGIPTVDMYLVEGAHHALLIDAGDSGGDLMGFVRTLTSKPVDLVVTHGHADHAAAIRQFDRIYMAHEELEILNAFFGFGIEKDNIIDLAEGVVFDLGGVQLEAIRLPGHTPASMLLLDRERHLLFTGDALGSGVLWMQLPHSTSIEMYLLKLNELMGKLKSLDRLQVWVGHECGRTLGYGISYVEDVRSAAEGIVSGSLIGTPTPDKSEIFGGLSAAWGQMTGFIYKPDRIREPC